MPSPSFDLGLRRSPGAPAAGGTGGTSSRTSSCAHAVRPRHWQSQLINLLRRRLEQSQPGTADVLINAGPGAGKTLGALLSFERLNREGQLSGFLVFCHRSSIAEQWLAAARRLGLPLQEWQPELDLQALANSALATNTRQAGAHGLLLPTKEPAASPQTTQGGLLP